MLREVVKWDYELRAAPGRRRGRSRAGGGDDLAARTGLSACRGKCWARQSDRANGAARAPRPARLSRPSRDCPARRLDRRRALPLIITGAAGRHPADSVALARLAERFRAAGRFRANALFRLPVRIRCPGLQTRPLLAEADLVIVLGSRCAVVPEQGSAARRRAHRADRRGPALRALPDAQLPLRSRDHRRPPRR